MGRKRWEGSDGRGVMGEELWEGSDGKEVIRRE